MVRRLAFVVAVLLASVVDVRGQSVSIGNRPGGNPLSITTVAFPSGGGAPMVDAPQRGTLALAGFSSATTGNLLVVNSAYVRLKSLGATTADAGNDGTVGLGRLTLAVVDTTHVTVTCGRNTVSAIALTCGYEIYSLPQTQIASIQSGFGTTVITSVNTAKAELDYLNINASNAANADSGQSSCAVTDATHITCTSPGSANTGSWRLVEWK